MVETYKTQNKRQKTGPSEKPAPAKETAKDNKKAKKAEDNALINVNVEEYKQNPEDFDGDIVKEVGA